MITLCGPDNKAADTAPCPRLVTVLDTEPVCVNITFSGSVPLYLRNRRETRCCKLPIRSTANRLPMSSFGRLMLGSETMKKGRLAQSYHHSFEWRALACRH